MRVNVGYGVVAIDADIGKPSSPNPGLGIAGI